MHQLGSRDDELLWRGLLFPVLWLFVTVVTESLTYLFSAVFVLITHVPTETESENENKIFTFLDTNE